MHVTAQPTPCRYLSEFARLSGACCTIQDFSDKHQHIVVLTPTWLLHLDTRWLALEFCNRLLSRSRRLASWRQGSPVAISAARWIISASTQSLTCAVIRCGIQWNIGRTARPVVFIFRKQLSMIHIPL